MIARDDFYFYKSILSSILNKSFFFVSVLSRPSSKSKISLKMRRNCSREAQNRWKTLSSRLPISKTNCISLKCCRTKMLSEGQLDANNLENVRVQSQTSFEI